MLESANFKAALRNSTRQDTASGWNRDADIDTGCHRSSHTTLNWPLPTIDRAGVRNSLVISQTALCQKCVNEEHQLASRAKRNAKQDNTGCSTKQKTNRGNNTTAEPCASTNCLVWRCTLPHCSASRQRQRMKRHRNLRRPSLQQQIIMNHNLHQLHHHHHPLGQFEWPIP